MLYVQIKCSVYLPSAPFLFDYLCGKIELAIAFSCAAKTFILMAENYAMKKNLLFAELQISCEAHFEVLISPPFQEVTRGGLLPSYCFSKKKLSVDLFGLKTSSNIN